MKQEDNGFPKRSVAVPCYAMLSTAYRSEAMRSTAQRRPSEWAGSEIKARTNL